MTGVDDQAPAAKPERAKPARHAPLTQRQLINKLMRIAAPARPSRSSVQLSRGPRGQVLIDVNVHQGDEPGLNSVATVSARAVEEFDRLCELYPQDFAGKLSGEKE